MERDREVLQAALVGYELGDELGRGGWGIVYAAVHQRLRREVAIKMLPRAFAADPEVRARFEEEAQFAARLSHPHVVSVFDFLDKDGVLAIIMERMQARNLAERFEAQGELQDTACALVIAVSSALHAAHRLGRVHRDVKPENVLFDSGDVPKLSDFGVAKIIGIGSGLTRHGDLIGTPAYMSPEQARGQHVGPESDVYATAILAYELLSGRLPFPPADTAMAELYQHVHEMPIPLVETNPDVAEPLARAVMRGLAKDPAQRYESAEAFAVAIAQAASTVFGSGWMRDAGVELRLTGRLVDAFRQASRPAPARRLPSLTTRAAGGGHPRLGTFYETAPLGSATAPPSVAGTGAEVTGFVLRGSTPTDERRPVSTSAPPTAGRDPIVAVRDPVASPDPRATIAPRSRVGNTAAPAPPDPAATDRRVAGPNRRVPPDPPTPVAEHRPLAPANPPPVGSTGPAGPEGTSRARTSFAPSGVALAPFRPSRRSGGSRRVMFGGVLALAVAAVIAVAAVAMSGRGSGTTSTSTSSNVASITLPTGSQSTTTALAPSTATPPLDRAGAVIATASLDEFEAACRSLGLRGGDAFCRCVGDALPGTVLAAEIDQATSYFWRRTEVLPPAVRSVMQKCTTD